MFEFEPFLHLTSGSLILQYIGWVAAIILFGALRFLLQEYNKLENQLNTHMSRPQCQCERTETPRPNVSKEEFEPAEYVNWVIDNFWPAVVKKSTPKVHEVVESAVRSNLSENWWFWNWAFFLNMNIGKKPPKIKNLKGQKTHSNRIVFTADVMYDSQCNVRATYFLIPAGFKDFQMTGQAELALSLTNNFPSSFSLKFPGHLDMDFCLTGLATFMETNQCRDMIRKVMRTGGSWGKKDVDMLVNTLSDYLFNGVLPYFFVKSTNATSKTLY